MPKRFKSAVWMHIACPECGEKYGIRLGIDEESRSGTEICTDSTNPSFANRNGFIWCGARLVYEVGRSYVYVGAATMQKQPTRFTRVTENNKTEKVLDAARRG